MTKAKVTEGEMLGLLRQRHLEKADNGEAWAFVTHVRSAAGFDSRRTIDALAMSLWPSRGLLLHGYEVKCSRSDWLRELKDPAKAEEFAGVLDYFSVVAADGDIVKPGELPLTWGLLVKRGGRLVTTTQAPALRDLTPPKGARCADLPPGFGRSFLAALLREACRVGDATPAQVREAREEASASEERRWASRITSAEKREEDVRARIAAFEEAAGIAIDGWHPGSQGPGDLGRAVRTVLDNGGTEANVRQRIQRVAEDARRIAEFAEGRLAEMTDPAA